MDQNEHLNKNKILEKKLPKILKAESLSKLNTESDSLSPSDDLNEQDCVYMDEDEIVDLFALSNQGSDSKLVDEFNFYNEDEEDQSCESEDEYEDLDDDDYDSKSKLNSKQSSTIRVRKFSDRVRNELEKKFQLSNFISGAEKKSIAKKLNLTERQVQKWFVHRREKLRRGHKKTDVLGNKLNDLNDESRSTENNKENDEKQTENFDNGIFIFVKKKFTKIVEKTYF